MFEYFKLVELLHKSLLQHAVSNLAPATDVLSETQFCTQVFTIAFSFPSVVTNF